jgi:hypothetical protein
VNWLGKQYPYAPAPYEQLAKVRGLAAGASEIRTSVPRLGWAQFVARKDIPRANFGAGAAAVQLDLFCSASHSIQPTAHSVLGRLRFPALLDRFRAPAGGLVYSPAQYGNFEPGQELGHRVDLVVVLASGKTVISSSGFVTAMLTSRDRVARLAQPHAAATALCQRPVASARKIRNMDREMRWR